MRETDLYAPVKRFLEASGCQVRGEVRGCDIAAVRGDELVVVELKRRFSLELVLQGIERQRLCDSVYLAVEAPGSRRRGGRWKGISRLCGRLGLGLLAVSTSGDPPGVEVVCDPSSSGRRKSKKSKSLLLKEFDERSGDHNVGGSSKRPLVTAYREAALRIACRLKADGPSSPRHMRDATLASNPAPILQRNVYGWFRRMDRGVYWLTPEGEAALETYEDVVKAWRQSDSAEP